MSLKMPGGIRPWPTFGSGGSEVAMMLAALLRLVEVLAAAEIFSERRQGNFVERGTGGEDGTLK